MPEKKLTFADKVRKSSQVAIDQMKAKLIQKEINMKARQQALEKKREAIRARELKRVLTYLPREIKRAAKAGATEYSVITASEKKIYSARSRSPDPIYHTSDWYSYQRFKEPAIKRIIEWAESHGLQASCYSISDRYGQVVEDKDITTEVSAQAIRIYWEDPDSPSYNSVGRVWGIPQRFDDKHKVSSALSRKYREKLG